MIEFHGFQKLLLGHAFLERMRDMDGSRSDQKRLAPGASEGWDVGGIGHNRGFKTIEAPQPDRGNLVHHAYFGAAIDSACQAVREGKLNSKQGAAQIQKLVDAQYRQYLMDVANA